MTVITNEATAATRAQFKAIDELLNNLEEVASLRVIDGYTEGQLDVEIVSSRNGKLYDYYISEDGELHSYYNDSVGCDYTGE